MPIVKARSFRISCATAVLFVAALDARGEDLLESVIRSHRGGRDAIRTCSCSLNVEVSNDSSGNTAGKLHKVHTIYLGRYERTLDAIRVRAEWEGNSDDLLAKDGVIHAVTRRLLPNGQEVVGAGVRREHDTELTVWCDVWARGLLKLNRPGTVDYFSFERLVEVSSGTPKALRKRIADHDYIVVTLSFAPPKPKSPGWELEVQFDPAVNYLISRTKATAIGFSDGSLHREHEVARFEECPDGVFFPSQTEHRAIFNGKCINDVIAKMANIQVNRFLPAEVFEMRYPQGVEFTDQIRGLRYKIDSHANPISPEIPQQTGKVVPPPPIPDAHEVFGGRETTVEPAPFTRWIFWASITLLSISMATLVWRKWHAWRKV
jgi:hypothetical protein